MKRQVIILVGAVPALALVLAACGGGSSSSAATNPGPTSSTTSGGHATTLELQADANGGFAFDKTSLEAPAGEVTIVMTNPSSIPHDIAIEGNGVDVVGETVTDGGTSTVTANLEPGEYTYLCTVDSHADAGMEGTLTVK